MDNLAKCKLKDENEKKKVDQEKKKKHVEQELLLLKEKHANLEEIFTSHEEENPN